MKETIFTVFAFAIGIGAILVLRWWNDEYDTTKADVSFSVDKYNDYVENFDLKYERKE